MREVERKFNDGTRVVIKSKTSKLKGRTGKLLHYCNGKYNDICMVEVGGRKVKFCDTSLEEAEPMDNMLKTADGQPPAPCSGYKDGLCEDTGKGCDGCYENSMRNFENEAISSPDSPIKVLTERKLKRAKDEVVYFVGYGDEIDVEWAEQYAKENNIILQKLVAVITK